MTLRQAQGERNSSGAATHPVAATDRYPFTGDLTLAQADLVRAAWTRDMVAWLERRRGNALRIVTFGGENAPRAEIIARELAVQIDDVRAQFHEGAADMPALGGGQ